MPSPRTFTESLSAPELDALVAAGRVRRFSRGELLVRAGDPADSAILLRAGLVKIHVRSQDGADVVLGLSGPGDLLGETSGRSGVRSADATALEVVDSVVVPVAALRAFLAEHPAATLALLDLALARLHVADARRLEFAVAETLARVTSRLVELADRFGTAGADGTVEVGLPITQEELASWSASSRESTARALRTLRELQLIKTRRLRLTVLDLERMRAHAARL